LEGYLLGEHYFDAVGWMCAFPGPRIRTWGTRHFHSVGEKARGNDAGVVQDQQVAGIEQRRKLGEGRIAHGSGRTIHH
jgi:hypothetical protein